MSIANIWSQRLGLALNPFFGYRDSPFGNSGNHHALLDGVTASFSLSTNLTEDPDPKTVANWAWSANLTKHVSITADQRLYVASAYRPDKLESYSFSEIENRLEEFLQFLSNDRKAPKKTVIDLIVSNLLEYRKAATNANASDRDLEAVQALLTQLSLDMFRGDTQAAVSTFELNPHALSLYYSLYPRILNSIESTNSSFDSFDFQSGVAIRHAGGAIFQQATTKLIMMPQLDLFGGGQTATLGIPDSLKYGGYFTPPGLARSLAESAIKNKLHLPEIRVCDPACGSGVFLSEALRALQRQSYQGRVTLVGQDISAVAVEIAKFVTKCAALDYGIEKVQIDINVGNSLANPPQGQFQVILMNPPFQAWEQTSPDNREQIRAGLGDLYKGKPDVSLGFANMAYNLLAQGGTLATLLPIGVMTGDYSRPWRNQLAEQSKIELLGALGDHYIFAFALVNIAALVVQRTPPESFGTTTMLWANEDSNASSTALRKLRQLEYKEETSQSRELGWRIYGVSQAELLRRANWAPNGAVGDSIVASLRMQGTKTLSNLFSVKQGIRTGLRQAFIISAEQLSRLPENERHSFKPVAEKDNIHDFSIDSDSFIFYAEKEFESEDAFRSEFPQYYGTFIEPNQNILRNRLSNKPIWKLSRERTWLKNPSLKIVSRMFIGRGQLGFAVDDNGSYAVVQGYGWIPNWTALSVGRSSDERLMALYVYSAIFSSNIFYEMVRAVSINIAGGQYDLSPKYISNLPLPDWPTIRERNSGKFESVYALREMLKLFAQNKTELEHFASISLAIRN
jgi:2-polyprenyl-3-methyl-5-hydroxy-6-metoxy-1,4-benzoquinol methylase